MRIKDLAMAYGAQTLFEGATYSFEAGCRYGVVGANGSGKSTLLKILSGTEEPSSGTFAVAKTTRIGTLKQDHFAYDKVPILHVVIMGIPELWAAMSAKEAMFAAVERGDIELDMQRYGELEETILGWDGYSVEARAAEILEGLSIPTAIHMQPLSTLSGGFKLRVLLAQTLASDPDVLLLDEPTNHLDIVSIGWLETFLLSYKGCAIIVSHDHRFMDTIATHIVDVDYERVTVYPGSYSAFERAKVQNRERKEAEISKREDERADHMAFIRRFKAKATKARQAQSRMKLVEKIEIEKLPESSRRSPLFKLGARRQTGKQVVEVEGISKAFGELQVLEDVSFTVQRGDRLAIIGPNGIGKSTLLKIMVGDLEPDAGKVEWGYQAEPGVFHQDQSDIRSCGNQTILEWLWSFCADQPTGFVRGKLAEVFFGNDEVDKKICALSGGELTRMSFARLGVLAPTVLVVDEPTNHLDLEGIEALADGLSKYPNAIIFVSHDRWFVSRLATRILSISANGVEDFHGTYEDFLLYTASRDHLDAAAVIAAEQERKRAAKRDKKKKDEPVPPAAVALDGKAAQRSRRHGPRSKGGDEAVAQEPRRKAPPPGKIEPAKAQDAAAPEGARIRRGRGRRNRGRKPSPGSEGSA
ncbi:MAG: hypothetical protein AUK47_19765 [Deltaproteobacteria bacterium CG2_30_63_29]|nr:MAG: hypothetical protein AUK47_19765 [Deltaproteobacteria bacterium CG2_30_63_29]